MFDIVVFTYALSYVLVELMMYTKNKICLIQLMIESDDKKMLALAYLVFLPAILFLQIISDYLYGLKENK